jgi:hypothetical protein
LYKSSKGKGIQNFINEEKKNHPQSEIIAQEYKYTEKNLSKNQPANFYQTWYKSTLGK